REGTDDSGGEWPRQLHVECWIELAGAGSNHGDDSADRDTVRTCSSLAIDARGPRVRPAADARRRASAADRSLAARQPEPDSGGNSDRGVAASTRCRGLVRSNAVEIEFRGIGIQSRALADI